MHRSSSMKVPIILLNGPFAPVISAVSAHLNLKPLLSPIGHQASVVFVNPNMADYPPVEGTQ